MLPQMATNLLVHNYVLFSDKVNVTGQHPSGPCTVLDFRFGLHFVHKFRIPGCD